MAASSHQHSATSLCGEVGVSKFEPSALGLAFIEAVRNRFADREFAISTSENPIVVFKAQSAEFGSIEVDDDDSELTIHFGEFTHQHFDCWEKDWLDDKKRDFIISNACQCLEDIFADRTEFKTVFMGGLSGEAGTLKGNVYRWSGKVGVLAK
jgi:hypothetical protein